MRADERSASTANLLGLVLVLALLATPVEAQCSMCRRVLESGEGRALIGVLRQAILVLLITPFLLVGIIGTLAVRIQRRTRPSEVGDAVIDPATQPAPPSAIARMSVAAADAPASVHPTAGSRRGARG